jgi:hypothetical protein
MQRGSHQAVEGDGLQAVRYQRTTIAALAAEENSFPRRDSLSG